MSTRTVADCDGCGAKDVGEDARLTVFARRFMDAAGSMDDEHADLDLCPACKTTAIREMTSRAEHGKATTGPELVQMVRQWRKR